MCAASAVKDRVQRKLPGLMEYPVRTPLTPAVKAASSKEQGDHSMWGKPRKASYQCCHVVSARCAWRELHCPNSSPLGLERRPRRKGARTRRDQRVARPGYWEALPIHAGRPSIRGAKGRTESLNTSSAHFAANAGSPKQEGYPPAWRRSFHITQGAPVMGRAADPTTDLTDGGINPW
jgi:hypothetical protein